MKVASRETALLLIVACSMASTAFAKDKEIAFSAAPAGVQATITKTTSAGATLEKVELEEESGNAQYGAKITDRNGVRWEIIMDAEGKVISTKQKKAKGAK